MQEFRLIFKLKGIERAARQFLRLTKGKKHFAFYGEMGVGKTTFISTICKLLNAEDLVSSPTFSIINEYNTQKGEIIYHFDFYRIKSAKELLDLGFNEYCADDTYCFIEWPEKGEEVIPDDFLAVTIVEQSDQKRLLKFSGRVN
jgi:tRNA threonylcarbamoyladenosine biosynthesis protein TsaE